MINRWSVTSTHDPDKVIKVDVTDGSEDEKIGLGHNEGYQAVTVNNNSTLFYKTPHTYLNNKYLQNISLPQNNWLKF